jgi:hypothetical protein
VPQGHSEIVATAGPSERRQLTTRCVPKLGMLC